MHITSFHVRPYECDVYGHVNNAVYMNYLEYARGEWLKHLELDYQALVTSGSGVLVAEAHLTYRSPSLPGEDLQVATVPLEVGAAWLRVSQVITATGRPVLDAEIKLVWVGPSGRPTRIPAEWKERVLKEV